MYNSDTGRGGGGREKKKFFANNVYKPGGRNNSTTQNSHNQQRATQIRQQPIPLPNTRPAPAQNERRIGPNTMLYLKDSPSQISDLTLFTFAEADPPYQPPENNFTEEARTTAQEREETGIHIPGGASKSFSHAQEALDTDIVFSTGNNNMNSDPPESEQQPPGRWSNTLFRPGQEGPSQKGTDRRSNFKLETPPPPPETEPPAAAPSRPTTRHNILLDNSSHLELPRQTATDRRPNFKLETPPPPPEAEPPGAAPPRPTARHNIRPDSSSHLELPRQTATDRRSNFRLETPPPPPEAERSAGATPHPKVRHGIRSDSSSHLELPRQTATDRRSNFKLETPPPPPEAEPPAAAPPRPKPRHDIQSDSSSHLELPRHTATDRRSNFKLETPPPPPEAEPPAAAPPRPKPRHDIQSDSSSQLEYAFERSFRSVDEPVSAIRPRYRPSRQGSFGRAENPPPPPPSGRKHTSGRGQSPPPQQQRKKELSPTRNRVVDQSIPSRHGEPDDGSARGPDDFQGRTAHATDAQISPGGRQGSGSRSPFGPHLFAPGSQRGRAVTKVDGLITSVVRVREPGDDTSEYTPSHHRRVASDPDALNVEPGEYENQNYRSEPQLRFNQYHEEIEVSLEPMPRVPESQTDETSSGSAKFYGGKPAARSLISDESRGKIEQPQEEGETEELEEKQRPSLLSIPRPPGEVASDESSTEAQGLRVEPSPLKAGISSSTGDSSLNYSTVGSGDELRIVSLPARPTSNRSLLSSPRGMRRSSFQSSMDITMDQSRADWPCSECAYVNGGSADKCALCGADVPDDVDALNNSSSFRQWRSSDSVSRSPEDATDDGPWSCQTCTYVNQNALHLSCEMCGEPRTTSYENSLRLDDEAGAASGEVTELTLELREKAKEKERILDLLAEQGKILTELQEMEAFKTSDNSNAVDQFQKEVAERGQQLDKIREELTQALEKEQEEQKMAEAEQQRKRSELLDNAGADSLSDLVGESAEAFEWMAQQRMLDEWRSLVEARSLQLEEMRLQQEESLTRYGTGQFSV